MAFPANPLNGQIYKNYVYNSSKNAWDILGSEETVFTPSNTSFAANTPILIANLGANLSDGTYALDIRWDGFFDSGGTNTVVWNGVSAGTLALASASQTYNSTPVLQLSLNSAAHHFTSAIPTFSVDSNSNQGNYGNLCLYMTAGWSGVSSYIRVRVRRLL
jgi:hypothetical protein